jgi:hypothetical protein
MGRTSGKIEEGSVTFSNETEKDIVFTGVSTDPPGFGAAPVVKLVGVTAGKTKFMSAQSNLLHQTALFVPTQVNPNPYPTNQASGFFNLSLHEGAMDLYRMTHPDYSSTISAEATNNYQYVRLGAADQITMPFNAASLASGGEDSTVQLLFRAKFVNWDATADDYFTIWFINKTTIDAASDSTPLGPSQTQNLTSKAYMLVGNEWQSLNNLAFNYHTITGVHLNTLDNNFNNGKWLWFKIDITKGTEALGDLGGFSFLHQNNSSETEYMQIANAFVFTWSSGYDSVSNNYWSGDDLFNNPEPVFSGNENFSPNIGISFSNVTNSGMKVRTSALFTGTIRYLCSEYG